MWVLVSVALLAAGLAVAAPFVPAIQYGRVATIAMADHALLPSPAEYVALVCESSKLRNHVHRSVDKRVPGICGILRDLRGGSGKGSGVSK